MTRPYDKIKIPKVTERQYSGRSAKYGEVKKEIDSKAVGLLFGLVIILISCVLLVSIFFK